MTRTVKGQSASHCHGEDLEETAGCSQSMNQGIERICADTLEAVSHKELFVTTLRLPPFPLARGSWAMRGIDKSGTQTAHDKIHEAAVWCFK